MGDFSDFPREPRLAKYELQERFEADPRPHKISLLGGTFKTREGETARLECVRRAVERLHDRGLPSEYLDAAGYRPFLRASEQLVFGNASALRADGLFSAHTPGGTAALRLGADLLRSGTGSHRIWVSDPTWTNHVKVFEAAGLEVRAYPYYRAAERLLDFDALLSGVGKIPAGDTLFLQASTHNPTCLDPTPVQWCRLAEIAAARGLLPFFDVAFFGFHTGVEADLCGLRTFAASGREMLVAASYAKSFGIYNERVGSLTLLGASEPTENAFRRVEHLIRTSYSNPPLHGAALMAELLADEALRDEWENELERIRARMAFVRRRMASRLKAAGVTRDLGHLMRERGLFTRIDLAEGDSDALREEHAIHVPPSGWINVTMITDRDLERVCRALAPFFEPSRVKT
jgi:aspartate/tyrosine/aromatic aminotransferase